MDEYAEFLENFIEEIGIDSIQPLFINDSSYECVYCGMQCFEPNEATHKSDCPIAISKEMRND